jgi:hypothetical protein
MSIQGLAYFVSKDEKYKTELYRMMEMGRWMDETYLDDWERDGIENMLMFERTAIFHFTIHASEILYKTVPFIYGDTIKNQAQRYSEILKMWWKDCQLGINENFENSYWISIDVKNRTWKNTGRTEVKPLNGEEKGVGAMIFFRYYSNVKYAPTLYRYFYSAVVIWEFCPELKVEAANKIVGLAKATNGEKLRWMFDPDGNQLHEANKDYHCTCDSEAPFLYLATYHSATAKGIL